MKRAAQLIAGIAFLAGCGGEKVPTETTSSIQAPSVVANRQESGGEDKSDVAKDLAALRQVTAPFHNFATAKHAGWSAQITPCMTDPGGAGGMGFHYGNTSLIDGVARVKEPELLLYEPEKNGNLRLVAVEYIIPYNFHSRESAPPELFGRQFQRNDTFQLWGLHAWVWEGNPSGVFANWNPRVNCAHTTNVSVMSHN